MSVDESVYCQEKARSLASLKANSRFAKKPCSKHLCSHHLPLLNLEPTQVVLDELHLLLRIGDVLIRNVILYADQLDHCRRERSSQRGSNYIRTLELHIRGCGVSFRIRNVEDEIGRPVPGKFEWTALDRKQKLCVLIGLPQKFTSIFSEDVSQVGKLWEVRTLLIQWTCIFICISGNCRTLSVCTKCCPLTTPLNCRSLYCTRRFVSYWDVSSTKYLCSVKSKYFLFQVTIAKYDQLNWVW